MAAAAPQKEVQVAMTDGDPRALILASRNILTNALEGSVCCCELKWGGGIDPAVDALGGRPPHLVFAADVAYNENSFGQLVRTLSALCDARTCDGHPPATAFLAYRKRVYDDTHFWHLLSEAFVFDEVPQADLSAIMRGAARPRKERLNQGNVDSMQRVAARVFRLHRRVVRVTVECFFCDGLRGR